MRFQLLFRLSLECTAYHASRGKHKINRSQKSTYSTNPEGPQLPIHLPALHPFTGPHVNTSCNHTHQGPITRTNARHVFQLNWVKRLTYLLPHHRPWKVGETSIISGSHLPLSYIYMNAKNNIQSLSEKNPFMLADVLPKREIVVLIWASVRC